MYNLCGCIIIIMLIYSMSFIINLIFKFMNFMNITHKLAPMKLFLSPRHCHPAPIAVPLLPHLSHPFTVTGMCLSSFHCHGSNASLTMLMSPCICHGVSVLVSLSPYHSHGMNPSSLSLHVAVLLSRSPCHCSPFTVMECVCHLYHCRSASVAMFLSPCLSHPIL